MTQEVVTSLARQLFPFHGIHHVNERAGESTREKKKKKTPSSSSSSQQ
jgi:hypothetical protein